MYSVVKGQEADCEELTERKIVCVGVNCAVQVGTNEFSLPITYMLKQTDSSCFEEIILKMRKIFKKKDSFDKNYFA